MHPNFMHFRQKLSFKSALEFFNPVSEHLRTALKELAETLSNIEKKSEKNNILQHTLNIYFIFYIN